MSTMRRCDFYLATDGKWYMMLGNHEYAYDDCVCTTYGPFPTQDVADEYLTDNFSNPGSCEIDRSGTVAPPKKTEQPRGPSVTHQYWRA